MDKQLDIVFNGQPVFQPGAEVAGFVLLHLDKPRKARSVKIEIDGRATTHWTVQESSGSGKNRSSHTVHFSADFVYVWDEIIAWTPGDSKYMDAGDHRFPFQFLLPSVPPSYEGKYGRIRYKIEATVDRPWRFDITESARFQVPQTFNFTIPPSLNFPAVTEASKELGMILFRHGQLSMEVTVPQQVYQPYEELFVQILVKNEASRDVEHLTLKLVKLSNFIAFRNGRTVDVGEDCEWGNTRWEKDNVAIVEEDVTVKAESEGRLECRLRIPWTEPSFDVPVCPIIQVTYQLKIKLTADGHISNKLKAELPILIAPSPDGPPSSVEPPSAPSFEADGWVEDAGPNVSRFTYLHERNHQRRVERQNLRDRKGKNEDNSLSTSQTKLSKIMPTMDVFSQVFEYLRLTPKKKLSFSYHMPISSIFTAFIMR